VDQLPKLLDVLGRRGVRPTLFVSYAVAADRHAAETISGLQNRGACEIGAHLHAWNTPPEHDIGGGPAQCHPYLYQCPPHVQRAKFKHLHDKLGEVFGIEPTSYRAGKFGLDPDGVALLREFGYKVDSSVMPMIDWHEDVQDGVPGPDFRTAPLGVYELSRRDVCSPGSSGVLEVPVSVGCTRRLPELLFRRFRMLRPERLPARVLGKLLGLRKRPVYPLPDMPLREIDAAIRWLIGRGVGYLNLMFHSSELIRNSLCGRTDSEVERFWRRITEIIDIAEDCQCQPGMTLGEFAQLIWAARGAGQNANDASSTGDH
jgi:hypothetical protein